MNWIDFLSGVVFGWWLHTHSPALSVCKALVRATLKQSARYLTNMWSAPKRIGSFDLLRFVLFHFSEDPSAGWNEYVQVERRPSTDDMAFINDFARKNTGDTTDRYLILQLGTKTFRSKPFYFVCDTQTLAMFNRVAENQNVQSCVREGIISVKMVKASSHSSDVTEFFLLLETPQNTFAHSKAPLWAAYLMAKYLITSVREPQASTNEVIFEFETINKTRRLTGLATLQEVDQALDERN